MPIIMFALPIFRRVEPCVAIPPAFSDWDAIHLQHDSCFCFKHNTSFQIPFLFLPIFVGIGSYDGIYLIHDFAHSASSFFTFSSTSARNLMISASISPISLSSRSTRMIRS